MKKILVVDDDPVSLNILTSYLECAGYQFEPATQGKEALELLLQNPDDFAAVLTDRVMPKLHGIDLIRSMQKHSILGKIPVILITGEAEKFDRLEATKAGVFDFLYKPIEEELLLSVLRRALK